MDNFYVYEWIRLDTNEPFYVGKGKGNRAYRISGRNKYFQNITKKVGIENIFVSILHDDLNEKLAHEYEVYYIDLYRGYGFNLTNLTDGGEGVAGGSWRLTEETKKKMSENSWIKGKGYLLSGEKSYWYGKKIPKELIERRGKNRRDFSGKNNPMYGKGYKLKGEKNGMYGVDRSGKNNPMYGKGYLLKGRGLGIKHSEEARKKMSLNHADFSGEKNGNAKGLVIIDIEKNETLRFGAMSEASKNLNISYKIIVTYSKSGKIYNNKYKFMREV